MQVLHSIKEIAENERKKSKLLSTTRAVSAMDIEDEVFSELEIEKMLALYSKQCVMEALGMLSYIYTISADARVTSFFSIIRESILSNSPLWETKDSLDRGFAEETLSFTHRGQQLVERLFLGKLASLDCVQRSKGGCVEKFMGFIMNDDHEVCNLAIALLREHFQQVQKFADQMSNVIYCSGNYLYPHYLSARASIAVMSSHLEMYWIREDMAANAQKLIEIFDELTECLLCDSSGGVCHELQNVVRALKAHELALKTLQIDMSNHKMMTERQKDYCKPLWKSLCTFLCVFIRGNEINVSLLSSMIGGGHLRGIGVGFSGADSVVVVSFYFHFFRYL